MNGFGFLFEMGTGKTLTAIAVMGAGYQAGHIRRVLIVAPASVCGVWTAELKQYADFPYQAAVLLGNKARRIQLLKLLEEPAGDGLRVAVINYEAIWREGIYEALQSFNADLMICDESQRIKSHRAAQSKAAHRLGDAARYRLILSGTPVQNNPLDLFSQYRFLDKTIFGDNFLRFRDHYAVMGGYGGKEVMGYQHLEELVEKEYTAAFRVTKAEALDLPEQVTAFRRILLTGQQQKLYDRLRKESLAELEEGEVTAATVLTRLLRLQQLTGGFLTTDDGSTAAVPSGKMEALEDILRDYVAESRKKLVIFARFVPEVKAIAALCRKLKFKIAVLFGETPEKARADIVKDFQTRPEVRVFIGQIDTAGAGITLTAADTCIYYSTTWNYASYTQSMSRIHRIGQVNRCTYIHLVAEETIDEKILEALAEKRDLAHRVVDSWREILGG